METQQSNVTEKMLNLTLEIIYLLTGENYIAFKLSSGFVASSVMKAQSPFLKPSSHPLTRERKNNEKVQEATNEIIDLLTREVPIRCQDVTVSFSMEEWEYLEGHKDLYKDVMMEKRPPLTSPDGSRSRNTPKRCPRYSRDATKEHCEVPQARPLYSQSSTQEHQELHQEHHEIRQACSLYSQDSTQEHHEIPQACPLYSQGSPQEHQEILQEGQDKNLLNVKEEEEEEPYVGGDEPYKEEELPPEISTDGQYRRNPTEKYLASSSDVELDENEVMYGSSTKNPIAINLHPLLHIADTCSGPSLHEECYPNSSCPSHHTAGRAVGTVLFSECPDHFIERSQFMSHQNSHTSSKPFSCLQCGKSFPQRSELKKHEIVHAAEKPHSCLECGKCFSRKSSLSTHEKLHNRVKPYLCSQCGKSFTDKSVLIIHQRIHTSEKPFSCSECGKCFAQSGNLFAHQRIHTGVKPFSCSECGECFSRKSSLVRHKKLHTGEKPFSCLECGKCFIQRGTLLLHQRTHTGDRPYACPECGKQFAKKTSLVAHLSSHRREELFTLG